jgi:hypothetical protein
MDVLILNGWKGLSLGLGLYFGIDYFLNQDKENKNEDIKIIF